MKSKMEIVHKLLKNANIGATISICGLLRTPKIKCTLYTKYIMLNDHPKKKNQVEAQHDLCAPCSHRDLNKKVETP